MTRGTGAPTPAAAWHQDRRRLEPTKADSRHDQDQERGGSMLSDVRAPARGCRETTRVQGRRMTSRGQGQWLEHPQHAAHIHQLEPERHQHLPTPSDLELHAQSMPGGCRPRRTAEPPRTQWSPPPSASRPRCRAGSRLLDASTSLPVTPRCPSRRCAQPHTCAPSPHPTAADPGQHAVQHHTHRATSPSRPRDSGRAISTTDVARGTRTSTSRTTHPHTRPPKTSSTTDVTH
jgi:hypothetical protein